MTSTPSALSPPEPPDKPALPRDLVLLFVQFSVALNKSRAYPPGHPVLVAAVDVMVQNLGAIFQRRPMLTIGITRTRLFVDNAGSDEDHPVIRDLSERLHRHQLAAIQFRPGVAGEEIADLFHALASETWRQGKPLGLEPLDQLLGRWPNVALEPLPLDQLELGSGVVNPAERQVEKVWQGLVNAALLTTHDGGATLSSDDQQAGGHWESAAGTDAARAPAPPVTGAEVARAIKSRRRDSGYNRQVVEWLRQVGEKLGDADTGSPVRQAVNELFAELDPSTLENMLQLGSTADERKELLRRGARTLPVKSVLDMLSAASSLSGQAMSNSLLRLFGKLAEHADTTRGHVVVGAEEVLRDSMRQLVGQWDKEDPDAHSHRDLLQLLSRPTSQRRGGASGKAEAGSLRVLQMGLELGVHSPEVHAAMVQVREEIGLPGMLDLVERGTFAGLDVKAIWETVADPSYLGRRLLDEDQDVTQVEQILSHIGPEAADPLLEALEHAESASRRRWLLRRLEEYGQALAPKVTARLPGKPWYVQRNLLGLLGAIETLPPGFHPDEYTRHSDGRVRREAYKLLFANPEWRAGAIVRAASDADLGIVRLALSAALEQLPPELAPRLLEHLSTRYKDQDIRLLAIRLLGKRPSTGGREWLVGRVAVRRGWGPFRRLKLEPKSPEVVAALVVLGQQFGTHPEVGAVLRMAQASRDPDVRAASRGVVPKGFA